MSDPTKDTASLTESELRARVDSYIAEQGDLDLLRFITCGSVDDGKSTLIGRCCTRRS